MSSQRITDLTPASFNQLDYCLIFRGYSSNIDRLQAIYQDIDIPIPFEQFAEMYRIATAERYNFFYISKIMSIVKTLINDLFYKTDGNRLKKMFVTINAKTKTKNEWG